MFNSETLSPSLAVHKKVLRLMGNRFEISVVWPDEAEAMQHIDAAIEEIRRIEALLTTYNEESQTALINRHAGIKPVQVDREVFDLIQRSKRISHITQGAFDISYGSIDKSLWNFDRHMTALPDAETAKRMVRLINYRNVVLDENDCTVFLKEEGMRIGFGGIGKGYAAERAKMILKQRGVQSGIVNAAGDLTVWGHQPNGERWTIGIANPNEITQAFSSLELSEGAVATSGNYEKFVLIDGKKYSHTIDPKTGLPVRGIKSVTVISPNAEIADAMATPVMIMGMEVGLDLINQINGLACIIIDDNDGLYTSKNINLK
ncbi:FAD:protein FMN transferase [Flavisolibacter ginsenosidimutans]|uniref:FAD:protein FMN transferase n=1 Tax=Flavisolibacter ginsenosidimutans TaxID=661481 RepID=A0A5B8UJ73_9BACT|nr:FAD:protein FMN transferase [Flavisolibacter ginsenosidimutans]QEC56734.1 FAD:protein FMN transferase [Flavisolibacter ginsenosidimutans]